MIQRLCEALQCDQVPGPLEILVDTMEWSQRLVITERDFQYMKAYINMMAPIKEKSDQLGAENVSTIHMIYPTLMEMIAHLDETSKKPLCKALATDMNKNIDFYFSYLMDPFDLNFDPIAITATYLSPVHRHILTEDQINVAEDHIKALLDSYAQASSVVSHLQETAGVDAGEEEHHNPGLKFLSKKITSSTSSQTIDPAAALKRDLNQWQCVRYQTVVAHALPLWTSTVPRIICIIKALSPGHLAHLQKNYQKDPI